jgi:arginase family enzyme
MATKGESTLRLHMPQWQGGNRPDYRFGSDLLAWLAPAASGPVETVPVPEPKPGEPLDVENGMLGRAALLRQARAGAAALADGSSPVLEWLAGEGIAHVAVHFDVDVLDPTTFGPVLFNDPDAPADFLVGVPRGRLAPDHVVRLLRDVAAACDVVGLAIAEYLPWEAIATRNLLRLLPLLSGWWVRPSRSADVQRSRLALPVPTARLCQRVSWRGAPPCVALSDAANRVVLSP